MKLTKATKENIKNWIEQGCQDKFYLTSAVALEKDYYSLELIKVIKYTSVDNEYLLGTFYKAELAKGSIDNIKCSWGGF